MARSILKHAISIAAKFEHAEYVVELVDLVGGRAKDNLVLRVVEDLAVELIEILVEVSFGLKLNGYDRGDLDVGLIEGVGDGVDGDEDDGVHASLQLCQRWPCLIRDTID